MIKSIVIEDEINSRELLSGMLQNYFPQICILGEASSREEAVQLIHNSDPDLVFLDVRLKDGESFSILDHFSAPRFRVIFTTGYDEYAIRAIKYGAMDYLLKPIGLEELEQAIERFKQAGAIGPVNIDVIKEAHDQQYKRIVLNTLNGYRSINLAEIVLITVKGGLSLFYLRNGEKIIASHLLSYYEKILPASSFFRAHKSFILNLHLVSSVSAGRIPLVIMENGLSVEIAARRKTDFMKLFHAVHNGA